MRPGREGSGAAAAVGAVSPNDCGGACPWIRLTSTTAVGCPAWAAGCGPGVAAIGSIRSIGWVRCSPYGSTPASASSLLSSIR